MKVFVWAIFAVVFVTFGTYASEWIGSIATIIFVASLLFLAYKILWPDYQSNPYGK